MAASARISHSINRHFHHSILLRTSCSQILFRKTPQFRSPHRFPSLSLNSHNHSFPKFQLGNPFSSLPASVPAHFSISGNYLDHVLFGPVENSFRWNFASGRTVNGEHNGIVVGDGGPEIAVVMLGWLGAKPKHLRRYVELYNDKGIHAVTFVASVMDVLSFDLGKKLEERVQRLSNELAVWLSDERGRDRLLIFHTFSNTGWLAYGAILDNLKDRQDLLGKIKGCIVDSGGDPNIDPKDLQTGKTIGGGHERGCLYFLDTVASDAPHALSTTISPYLWHCRLGHPTIRNLQKMISVEPPTLIQCESCELGKHHRSFFQSRVDNRSSFPFSLVYCDIWGPSRIESRGVFYCPFILVDDYSRMTWLYLLKDRTEVPHVLKSFYNEIKTQFSVNLHILCTDNALEFNQKSVSSFCDGVA